MKKLKKKRQYMVSAERKGFVALVEDIFAFSEDEAVEIGRRRLELGGVDLVGCKVRTIFNAIYEPYVEWGRLYEFPERKAVAQ